MTTKEQIRPLGTRVVVERHRVTASKGGILLPESAQEKPKEGTILSVGPGTKTEPMELSVGQRVLFSGYSGTELKDVDAEGLLILRQEDILGVITNS